MQSIKISQVPNFNKKTVVLDQDDLLDAIRLYVESQIIKQNINVAIDTMDINIIQDKDKISAIFTYEIKENIKNRGK